MELPEVGAYQDPVYTSCPACGGSASVVTGPPAPAFSACTEFGAYLQPEYSILGCETCGLLYRSPTISTKQLASYYSEVDFRKWEISGHFPTERAALSVLRKLPQGASLLDFGCSTGRMLAPLVKDYRCHGFEVDPRAAKEAAAKGITMLQPGFLDSRSTEMFDGVVMMDVFEHLQSPTKVLHRLSEALKPGGILVVGTGNGDAPACRLDPAQFWYFRNIEHLSMLTIRHGRWLAQQLGMTLVRWDLMCHYDHSLRARCGQYLRHAAFWAFRRSPPVGRTLLRLVPRVRRAEGWKVAPAFSASRDHVIAIFLKPGGTP